MDIPTLLLVDDHTIVRQGIRRLLDQSLKVKVIGDFSSGREALASCEQLNPDIVLTDVDMPGLNGIELTRQICGAYPATAVIMLSMYSSQQYVIESLRAGAKGYVLKDAAIAELLAAIRAVAEGKRYLSPGLTDVVVNDCVRRANGESSNSEMDKLTGREREILTLLAEGCTSKQVRAVLYISERTVDAHRVNIMKKLDIHSIAGLTKFAITHGLTSKN